MTAQRKRTGPPRKFAKDELDREQKQTKIKVYLNVKGIFCILWNDWGIVVLQNLSYKKLQKHISRYKCMP